MLRRPPSSETLDWPLNWPLLQAREIAAEIVAVNGASAPVNAIEQALLAFGRHIKADVRVEHRDLHLPAGQDGSLIVELLLDAAELPPPAEAGGAPPAGEGLVRLAILVVPALADKRWRGLCHVWPHAAPGEITVILNAAKMRRGIVRLLPARPWWRLVVLHELLHALGLPSGRNHWRDSHCTCPWCVLYSIVDWRSVLCTVARMRLPMKLCGQCRRDLQRPAPAGWQPVRHKDGSLGYLDALVAMNDQNPRAWAKRAEYLCRRHDPAAIADLTRAIELGHPRKAGCYFNRGQMHLLAGNAELARADFESCLAVEPGHANATAALSSLNAAGKTESA